MARTKQTARGSTGGFAERKTIASPVRVLRSHGLPLRSLSPTPDAQMAEIPTIRDVVMVPQPAQMARPGNDDSDHVSDWLFEQPFSLTFLLVLSPLP